jgi:peptidoglycan L-alanyl-D-glutamate endopeptidase CwlK
MPIDSTQLVTEFKVRLDELVAACNGLGVEMRPYFGIRTPFEQARFWRQSRAGEEIKRKIRELRDAGAPFLADCLDSVGPQNGPPVTNALPGLSWHQWGEAADSVWIVSGNTEWSTQKKINGVNGYRIYAEQAQLLGLDPGGLWKSLKDWPHAQLRTAGSPLKVMTLVEVDRVMRERFGG